MIVMQTDGGPFQIMLAEAIAKASMHTCDGYVVGG